MLFRLIWLVVFLILAAASANWLMGQPGQMQLEWLDWRIEIRTSLAVSASQLNWIPCITQSNKINSLDYSSV